MTLAPADVVSAIMNGDVDDNLDIIRQAVREREKTRGDILRLTIKAGTRVRLKGLSPKYLNGMTGTVKPGVRRGKRISVELDREVPRFGKTVNPPAACLEVIE